MKTDATTIAIPTYPPRPRAFSELGWLEQCNRVQSDARLLHPASEVNRALMYQSGVDPHIVAKDLLLIATACENLAAKLRHMAASVLDDPSVLLEE